MTTPAPSDALGPEPRPSNERNGCFLDKHWCCKVCDGEIPDGHTDNCYIWKLEKKHTDFIANEYNAVLIRADALAAECAALRRDAERYAWLKAHYYAADFFYPDVGSVLIFDMGSQERRVSASLDATVDEALASDSSERGKGGT